MNMCAIINELKMYLQLLAPSAQPTTPKSLSNYQSVDILKFLTPERDHSQQTVVSPKRKLSDVTKENDNGYVLSIYFV